MSYAGVSSYTGGSSHGGAPGLGAPSFMLSGSSYGKPILIGTTASPGTLIHTATSVDTMRDLLYLWFWNIKATAVALTVQWGGETDPDHLLCKEVSFPAHCPPTQIAYGFPLQMGLVVRAFSSSADYLLCTGYIERRGA